MAQPDLTTVPKVKDYLRQRETSEQMDLVIQDFITIASRLVRSTTGRRFSTPRTLETREYRTYGRHKVYVDEVLDPLDIASVMDENGIGVRYDADFEGERGEARGATIELSPFDYDGYGGIRGLPMDHADNFIRELRPTFTVAGPLYPRKVIVRATFGYDEDKIPQEVEFAARRAVALWFKEEVAHYTDDAFISRGRRFEPDELPPLSMAILRGGNWIVEDPVMV